MGSLFMTIEIEPGTSEGDAAQEMVRLTDRIRITVEAKHNGVMMIARPDQTPEEVMRDFERECRLQNYPKD